MPDTFESLVRFHDMQDAVLAAFPEALVDGWVVTVHTPTGYLTYSSDDV